MALLPLLIVSTLISAVPIQTAAPQLAAPDPVTVTFSAEPTLEVALDAVCRVAGVTCRLDPRIDAAMRAQAIGPAPLAFVNASLDKALSFLTSRAGLAYTIVDSQTVWIHPQGR
jgi:hypothetical protein